MNNSLKLSVHIVTCGRLDLLKSCYQSVLAALPPKSEVLIIVNGHHPQTKQWLLTRKEPQLRWLEVPKEHWGRSRNRAFVLCRGEVVHFLDDDVTVPKHLFSQCLKTFNTKPDLAVLGGPNLTPIANTFQQKVFGAAMSSGFAAPLANARYQAEGCPTQPASSHDLIFCNLAVRPSKLRTFSAFEESLVSNQENLFLHRIQKQGAKCLRQTQLYVYHHRRKSLKAFIEQIFSYGQGRAQQTWLAPSSFHPAFAVPALCVALFLFGIFHWPAWVWITLFGAHTVGSVLGALLSSQTRKLGWKAIAGVSAITGLIHLSYGLGFWVGLLRFKNRRPKAKPIASLSAAHFGLETVFTHSSIESVRSYTHQDLR